MADPRPFTRPLILLTPPRATPTYYLLPKHAAPSTLTLSFDQLWKEKPHLNSSSSFSGRIEKKVGLVSFSSSVWIGGAHDRGVSPLATPKVSIASASSGRLTLLVRSEERRLSSQKPKCAKAARKGFIEGCKKGDTTAGRRHGTTTTGEKKEGKEKGWIRKSPLSHCWWLKFLLPDVRCHAFFWNRCAAGQDRGNPGAGTEPTRAISSGTTTEAVTRPSSGRVDISAVRLRADSRLSVRKLLLCVASKKKSVWPIRRLPSGRRCYNSSPSHTSAGRDLLSLPRRGPARCVTSRHGA